MHDTITSAESVSSETPSQARITAEAFLQWASNRRGTLGGRVVLVADERDVDAVTIHLSEADVVLAPGSAPAPTDGPMILHYDGRLIEPGDVVRFGDDYELELQDYLSIAFLPVARPTIVHLGDAEGWAAMLADADAARAIGYFLPQLGSRTVVLADAAYLGAPVGKPPAVPERFQVDLDGVLRLGIDGRALGPIGTVPSTDFGLERPASDALASLGVDTDDELQRRPWFGRYLAALRLLSDTGPSTWASGFGRHLLPGLGADPARATPLVLVHGGDGHQLVDLASGRRFTLDLPSAEAAEALLETGDVTRAARALGSVHPKARDLDARLRSFSAEFAAAGIDLLA